MGRLEKSAGAKSGLGCERKTGRFRAAVCVEKAESAVDAGAPVVV
eukprot:COSAG02_NODE_68850_length_217_cov_9.533898_2_plen_44_part_01